MYELFRKKLQLKNPQQRFSLLRWGLFFGYATKLDSGSDGLHIFYKFLFPFGRKVLEVFHNHRIVYSGFAFLAGADGIFDVGEEAKIPHLKQ